MTRAELINAVKVKLEEYSPFESSSDTGLAIVTATTLMEDSVRPVHAYIDKLLDESAREVLQLVPCSLILSDSANVGKWSASSVTKDDGVGYISIAANNSFIKIYSIRLPNWYRAIHEAITPQTDPYLYEQQGNPTLRGKKVNPVVAIANGNVELYSVDNTTLTNNNTILNYVKATTAEAMQTDLQPLVVMQCAVKVCEIYNRTESVRLLAEEFQQMLQSRILSNSRTSTITTQTK